MAAAALEIEGLRFRYGATGPWVVDVASLVVEPGEQVLLTGGSGEGKSSLLNLIAGVLDPAEGTVRVAGQAVHELRPAARDRFRGAHVGMIFQTFHLLQGFTAIENVMAALLFSPIPRREHKARAAGLLDDLGLERHAALVESLSVGQQQRVAVARAVACEPILVLADEPTASLDPARAASAIELIQQACRSRGAALVCTSHDPAMADRFQRRIALASLGSGAQEATSWR